MPQQSFVLAKGPSPDYPCIGFSLDSERPEVFLPLMADALKDQAYCGPVLIDALACNGMSTRRYFVAEFDGQRFAYSTVKIAAALDSETLEFSNAFYELHADELSRSVLSAEQQLAVSRACANSGKGEQ